MARAAIVSLFLVGALVLAGPARADEPAPAPTAPAVALPPAPPAAAPSAVVSCCPEPSCCNPGLSATAGLLFLKVRRSDTVYAMMDDDGVGAFGSQSDQPEVDWEYEIGFRAGLRWTQCGACCWDYGVTATYLTTDADDSYAAPNSIPKGTLSPPSFPAARGSSEWSTDYLVIDADVGYTFCGECFSARAYGGVRFLSIQEDVDRQYSTQTGGQSLLVSSSTEMTGVGLHAGIEPRLRLCRGWSVFGRFGGGVLLGRFEWSQDETQRETGDPDITSHLEKAVDQDVTFLEAALGITWESDRLFGGCAGLRVSAGYEFTSYSFLDFGISGPIPFGSVDVEDSTFSVDGFFLTLDVLF